MNVRSSRHLGFSLVEVVLAVGVLAISTVVVVGLFGPVARFTSDVGDSGSATHLVGIVSDELYRLPYATVAGGDFAAGTLYANEGGNRIGAVLGTGTGEVPSNQAYFRINFVRDNSPASDGFAEFTLTMEWPFHLADGTEQSVEQRRFLVFKVVVPPSR